MQTLTYADSKEFLRAMRKQVQRRDVAALESAVSQMQEWLSTRPNDQTIGTALEEFDTLLEAARLVSKPRTDADYSETWTDENTQDFRAASRAYVNRRLEEDDA